MTVFCQRCPNIIIFLHADDKFCPNKSKYCLDGAFFKCYTLTVIKYIVPYFGRNEACYEIKGNDLQPSR
jgi:hypothetical protein